MNGHFSPAATAVLAASGWYEGRLVDIARWVRALNADGYEVSPVVATFLQEFGGLRLTFPHFKVQDVQDDCHFEPTIAAANVSPDWATYWGGFVDERLCVVGEAHRGNMTLLMGTSGHVFAGRDELLLRLGGDGIAAIETLCTNLPAEQVMT